MQESMIRDMTYGYREPADSKVILFKYRFWN
jgi:hypothetical protein